MMAAHVNSHWEPSKDAGIPIRETVINPAFTNIQSADAGLYECVMVVTLESLCRAPNLNREKAGQSIST